MASTRREIPLPDAYTIPADEDIFYEKGRAAMRDRHGFRFNISFCDTHVETLKPKDFCNVRREDQLKRWNYDHQRHWELVPKVFQ